MKLKDRLSKMSIGCEEELYKYFLCDKIIFQIKKLRDDVSNLENRDVSKLWIEITYKVNQIKEDLLYKDIGGEEQ